MIRFVARWILALFMIVAGVNHFLTSALYVGMMPPWVPEPEILHRIAGGAEVLGGLGLLIPAVRRAASWGLILLLVAVFPANLHAALTGEMPGVDVAPWVLWARLPFQAVFIGWAWWVGRSAAEGRGAPSSN